MKNELRRELGHVQIEIQRRSGERALAAAQIETVGRVAVCVERQQQALDVDGPDKIAGGAYRAVELEAQRRFGGGWRRAGQREGRDHRGTRHRTEPDTTDRKGDRFARQIFERAAPVREATACRGREAYAADFAGLENPAEFGRLAGFVVTMTAAGRPTPKIIPSRQFIYIFLTPMLRRIVSIPICRVWEFPD